MTEDVAKVVEELAKLHQDGSKKFKGFKERFDDLCDEMDGVKAQREQIKLRDELARDLFYEEGEGIDDFMLSQPSLELQQPVEVNQEGLSVATLTLAYNKPIFVALRDEINAYVASWRANVLQVLSDGGFIGARLHFETHSVSIEPSGHVYEQYIPDVKNLGETLREFEQRLLTLPGTISDIQQQNNTTPIIKRKIKARYIKEKQALEVDSKLITFRKDCNFRKRLCEIMFDHPKKTWTTRDLQKVWEDNYEFTGDEKPSDWQRVGEALKQIQERIRKKTGIEDLFIFDTKTAKLNPKYLQK